MTALTGFMVLLKHHFIGSYDFALEQNYPNPFNPSTVIKYSIPENGMVTIKLYDILGSEAAVLL